MKTLYIFIFTFLLPSLVFADNFRSKPPIKWGKISEEEKQLSVVDYEPDAPAVILCDYGTIEISNRSFYRRHVRIKILNKKGLKHTTIEIPYQYKNKYDDVQQIKAQVLHVKRKGKIETREVNYKDIKDIQIGEYTAVKRITFADAKVGSIIEYTYEIASMDFVTLDDWVFQNELPTLWSEIRFEVPEPFVYLMTYQKGPELTREEKIAFALSLEKIKHTKWRKSRRQLSDSQGILFQSMKKNYVVHVVNQKKKKIVHRSLPSLSGNKHEQLALNRAPKIRFHLLQSQGILPPFYKPLLLSVQDDFEDLSRWEIQHEIQPAGFIHYRLENWAQFNQRYLTNERFGKIFNQNLKYAAVLNEIISEKMTSTEKLEVITQYLRSKVIWNGVYDSYVRKDLNRVLHDGEGSSSEMNFLFMSLLSRAGLNVTPVLAKTVDQGRVEKVYPVRDQFNHVLALVSLEDEHMMMDLTVSDKNRAVPVNPEGWMVKKVNYGWIDIVKPRKIHPQTKKNIMVSL